MNDRSGSDALAWDNNREHYASSHFWFCFYQALRSSSLLRHTSRSRLLPFLWWYNHPTLYPACRRLDTLVGSEQLGEDRVRFHPGVFLNECFSSGAPRLLLLPALNMSQTISKNGMKSFKRRDNMQRGVDTEFGQPNSSWANSVHRWLWGGGVE